MRINAWLVPAMLLATPAGADLQFSGYAKSYAVAVEDIDFYQSQNGVRLMLDDVESRFALQIHYEISPVLNSRALPVIAGAATRPGLWRASDINPTLSDSSRHPVYENLDRLNVQFKFDAGDLTIGRQAITFGIARVINPTDVFLPFDVRTLNTEYRIGVDAIRFQHPFGQLSELDVGVIVGDDADSDTSAAFLQVRTNMDGKDLEFALARFANQRLIGGGVQTALGDMGFWFEAAAVSGRTDYVRVSTGLDYAFTENVFGLVEYHYNGAGTSNEGNYTGIAGTTPYQTGSVFLLGENYLIPAVNMQLSPLWSAGVEAIINLSDGSAFANVSASYNASQNLYMDFGYYHFLGGAISEYGSSPSTAFASLRYYF